MAASWGVAKTLTTLGLFFDKRSESTRWVWLVDRKAVIKDGKTIEIDGPVYIDAQSGKPIDRNAVATSQWRYRSRAPRQGLVHVEPSPFAESIFKAAARRMLEFGQPTVQFNEVVHSPVSSQWMFLGKQVDLTLGPKGDFVSFAGHARRGSVSRSVGLATARKLVRAELRELPEGAFTFRSGPGMSSVTYGQRAFGYDYLGPDIVSIHLGADGVVTMFRTNPPAPRPLPPPKSILSAYQIQDLALRSVQSFLSKTTGGPAFDARVQTGRRGWYRKTGHAILCYEVSISLTDRATHRGFGRIYHFDAQTGLPFGPFILR
jgi:hypothetical protein